LINQRGARKETLYTRQRGSKRHNLPKRSHVTTTQATTWKRFISGRDALRRPRSPLGPAAGPPPRGYEPNRSTAARSPLRCPAEPNPADKPSGDSYDMTRPGLAPSAEGRSGHPRV